MSQILKASLIYFVIVFGAGFVFGIVRTLWVAPQIGTRWAELAETPVMVLVTIISARWVVVHLSVPPTRSARLLMGGAALAFMLFGEFSLVSWVRRLSIKAYFAERDRVSGTVYYLALLLFAIMPLLVAGR